MLEYVDAADVANEAKMIRTKRKTTVVFVEGDADSFLFNKFFDLDNCDIIIAQGKKNCLGAREILQKERFEGVVYLIDADHDRLLDLTNCDTSVIYSDKHDFDMMILSSDALMAVVDFLCSKKKLNKFIFSSRSKDLLECLLDITAPIGWLRYLSVKKNWQLRLKDIDPKGIYSKEKLTPNIKKLILRAISNSKKCSVPALEIEREILEVVDNSVDKEELCSGHDVTTILAFSLRSTIGSKPPQVANRQHIEGLLRLSFDTNMFKQTNCYHSLVKWEQLNPKFRLLKHSN